jgi:short subunit dehydrogenase-like uncharacterized protein
VTDRDLDVVLVGATGFVGRLTAAHLARHAPDHVRIGLAARSAERLPGVREELGVDWPTIVLDTSDEGAVRDLAARTRVVATTVGPFLRHGMPLLAACAEAGTAYADLTGESEFVRRSIAAHHDAAERSGARIVHSCGFDSIPSDLGLGLAHAAAGGGEVVETVYQVRSSKGGVSGGTVDSLRQQLIEARSDPGVRRVIGDPYALTDGPAPGRRLCRADSGLRLDPRSGHWQAPFVMGPYNTQIVQRTNFLTGWSYGPGMRYREVVDTGRGWAGRVTAAGIAVGQAAFVGAMGVPLLRSVLDRVLPEPGQGPSERTRANGRFSVDIDVTPTDGPPVRTTFAADHDPGYDGTAVMLGESALGLALDALPERAGVLTPMTALGPVLADRLRAQGFTITVDRLDQV